MIAHFKLIFAAVWLDIKDTYERSKIVLLTILALIGYFEYDKIKEAVGTYMNQKQFKQANAQDEGLKAQETSDNDKADQLVKDASSLSVDQKVVAADWYKNEK